MQKQLHKILLIFCLGIFLTGQVGYCESQIDENGYTQVGAEVVTKDSVKVNDLDIEPLNTKELKKTVVPNTKKEGKKVFALFLKTMSAVGLSVIFLYFILLLAKKFQVLNLIPKNEESDEYDFYDLATPNDKQDALKSFLNKTK